MKQSNIKLERNIESFPIWVNFLKAAICIESNHQISNRFHFIFTPAC